MRALRDASADIAGAGPATDPVPHALLELADTAAHVGAVIAEVEQFEKSWDEQLLANAGEWAVRTAAAGGARLGLVDDTGSAAVTAHFQEQTRRAEAASERRRVALLDWHRTCEAVVRTLRSATLTLAGPLAEHLDATARQIGAVDRRRVDEARATLRAALDPGGWGVRQDDLDRIRDTLAGLSGPELDAVVAGLDDDELHRWFDQMNEGWIKGGWPEDRVRELLVLIGEKGSLTTWRRLAGHTDLIDPPLAEAIGDAARDDPATRAYFEGLRYESADAPLAAGAGTGFDADDVQQGQIGDCYLIAGLKALALRDPDALRRLITPNPNGTWTVRFGDGSEVVVSAELPRDGRGLPPFASTGNGRTDDELWPMLVEKAYAQRYGGWDEIAGGHQSEAIENLTGRPADDIPASSVTVADLARRWRDGEILGIGTLSGTDDADDVDRWRREEAPEPYRRGRIGSQSAALHPRHAFIITAVDEANGTVTVTNPWYVNGPAIVLTEAELRESINSVQVNER